MKRYAAISAVVLLLILLALGAGNSFAWFSAGVPASAGGQLGRISLELDYEPRVGGETEFTLENAGSLAVYVRLGYTFVYKNGQGAGLLKDVSGVRLGEGSLYADGVETAGRRIAVTERAGAYEYDKEFIVPCTPQGQYYRLSPGETLTGWYIVEAGSAAGDEALHVVWVAEAIQGSRDALADAAVYGWDPAMA